MVSSPGALQGLYRGLHRRGKRAYFGVYWGGHNAGSWPHSWLPDHCRVALGVSQRPDWISGLCLAASPFWSGNPG